MACEWERHASLMAMLEGIQAAVINPHLEKQDRIKPRKAEEFLPAGFVEQQQKRRRVTLAQQLAMVAKAFGGKFSNGHND